MRSKGRIAVIVGAGQNPGEDIGNGCGTTLRFGRDAALAG
jgi:hypothetical protein